MQTNEQWVYIKGYDGQYMISNFGRVKSFKNWKDSDGRVLKTSINSWGYIVIGLSYRGENKTHTLHHLVWDHFGNMPRDGRKLQIDHKDGDKTNNHIYNLQLLSQRDNTVKYHKSRCDKKNRYIGAYPNKKKWMSLIYVDGKSIFLGNYDTPEQAHTAYLNAKSNLS